MAKQSVDALVPTAEVTDQQFALQVGKTVTEFLKRATQFFTQANELETVALKARDLVKNLKAVTNSDDDLTLQKTIQIINVHKKKVEDHWEITSIVHRFHRRLTARRDIAIAALKEASDRGNQLHNDFVAAERRKAEAERARLQKIADDQAAADRAKELAELDKQALAAEAASEDLSERERIFVDRVVRFPLLSLEWAARQAGYKDPVAQGKRLCGVKKIARAIEGAKTAASLREHKAAVQESPVEVRRIEVTPDVQKAAGTSSRTNRSASLFDEAALIAAVIAGKHNIPADVLQVDLVKLNSYARDLGELINQWPGVELKTTTKVV